MCYLSFNHSFKIWAGKVRNRHAMSAGVVRDKISPEECTLNSPDMQRRNWQQHRNRPALPRDLRPNCMAACLTRAPDQYEQARKIWNGMIDCRPRFIVRCASAGDAAAAIGARRNGLAVAVRGGGHDIAGNRFARTASSSTFPGRVARQTSARELRREQRLRMWTGKPRSSGWPYLRE